MKATNSLSRKDRLTLSSATCVSNCVTYLLQIPLSSSMDGNLSRAGTLPALPRRSYSTRLSYSIPIFYQR